MHGVSGDTSKYEGEKKIGKEENNLISLFSNSVLNYSNVFTVWKHGIRNGAMGA